MSEQTMFGDTPLPSPIREMIVQITSSIGDEDHYASGTGVIVAPHLAFAARHVLEEHWERHHPGRLLLSGESAAQFSFVLTQQVNNDLNLWMVTRLWVSDLTDIILLRLTPLSAGAGAYTFRALPIDVMPPRVGERIYAFGYSESAAEVRAPKELLVQHRAIRTQGVVVEVHHQQRDPIKMPFPCFRTNARFDGGMSGGPVFNESGHLCGLICSSYPPFTADEEHASYVAAVWPVMAIPMDLDRVGKPNGIWYRTFDLIADGILIVQNSERLVVGELAESRGCQASLTLPPDRQREHEP